MKRRLLRCLFTQYETSWTVYIGSLPAVFFRTLFKVNKFFWLGVFLLFFSHFSFSRTVLFSEKEFAPLFLFEETSFFFDYGPLNNEVNPLLSPLLLAQNTEAVGALGCEDCPEGEILKQTRDLSELTCEELIKTPQCQEVHHLLRRSCGRKNSPKESLSEHSWNIAVSGASHIGACLGSFSARLGVDKLSMSALWLIFSYVAATKIRSAIAGGTALAGAGVYLYTEFQKQYEKTKPPHRIQKTLSTLFWSALQSVYQALFPGTWSCLSPPAKTSKVCVILTGIVLGRITEPGRTYPGLRYLMGVIYTLINTAGFTVLTHSKKSEVQKDLLYTMQLTKASQTLEKELSSRQRETLKHLVSLSKGATASRIYEDLRASFSVQEIRDLATGNALLFLEESLQRQILLMAQK